MGYSAIISDKSQIIFYKAEAMKHLELEIKSRNSGKTDKNSSLFDIRFDVTKLD